MLSLHPEQELDRIAAGLAGSGALALLLIEAEPLARIERRYGGEAYRQSMEGLKALVHELVHLLNRRYLGPALPSWLDEGLAEELAMSHIGTDGTLVPGRLGSWEVPASGEGRRLLGGGLVVLNGLRSRMRWGDLPSLERLVGLDRTAFQAAPEFRIHYALSAFWVRYLLSGESPAGAVGFRGFLAAVASGEPLDRELLQERLGAGWSELESGFRRWLDAGAGAA